jgi:hypothetical protein
MPTPPMMADTAGQGLGEGVLTDPWTASYALLVAPRGIWITLTPRSWPAILRALRGGFGQSRTQGHAFQQGGVAIIDSSGWVRWSYVSQFAGDHPLPTEIVARLWQALGKSAAADHARCCSRKAG